MSRAQCRSSWTARAKRRDSRHRRAVRCSIPLRGRRCRTQTNWFCGDPGGDRSNIGSAPAGPPLPSTRWQRSFPGIRLTCHMRTLAGSIRYAVRQFRQSPVFTAAAVLTLALGIGGTTAIFSLIHTVMLRSLPVADPASLFRVGDGNDCCVEGGPQDRWGMYSYPLYVRLKDSLPEFEEVTAFQAGPNRMSVRRESEKIAKPLRSEYVTGSYFSTFGIRPFGGRLFSANDDQPSSAPVAVLS